MKTKSRSDERTEAPPRGPVGGPNHGPNAGPGTGSKGLPFFGVDEIHRRTQALQEVLRTIMKDGTHYGTLPGMPKPSLWKAGAEVLCLAFQLAPMLESRVTIDDPEAQWNYQGRRRDGVEVAGTCRGYFEVEAVCTIFGATGDALSRCSARCNNRETHYRNLGMFDLRNTILKMAEKRAFVSAALMAAGASDLFTQDLEDLPGLVELEPQGKPPEDRPQAPIQSGRRLTAKREAWLVQVAEEAKLPRESLDRCLAYLRSAESQAVKRFFDDLARRKNVFEPFLLKAG